jgi:diacylglycerol kinase (ATP)
MNGNGNLRKVRALINPKSGFMGPLKSLEGVLRDAWQDDSTSFDCLESLSPEDGRAKATQAVQDGIDTLVVVGGDGTLNTISAALIGSQTAMAAIPAGSGNGFARHFGIPLNTKQAAISLKNGRRVKIDVGVAAGRPFFVTCGLAWEAEIVKGFENYPIRGIPSYVFGGLGQVLRYAPQNFRLTLDGEAIDVAQPILLTVANLSQYGAGVKIAPDTRSDDGSLSLIVVPKGNPIHHLRQIVHLIEGRLHDAPQVLSLNFRSMLVERERPDPIQMDGELHEAGASFRVEVLPSAVEIIIPFNSTAS